MLQMEWETIQSTFMTMLEQRMSDGHFMYGNYVASHDRK